MNRSNQRTRTPNLSTERNREEITFSLKEHLGTIGTSRNGWLREVNILAWNDQDPGFDIRSWSPDHTKMSKGVNLTIEETENLRALFQDFHWEDVEGLVFAAEEDED